MRQGLIVASVCLLLLSGCSRRLGDCTIMSTKNIYCKNVDLTKLAQHPGLVGKDIRFWGIGSNMKDAADKALEQANSNLLIDVVIYYEEFPLVCGGYVVKGNGLTVPYATRAEAAKPTTTTDQNGRKIISWKRAPGSPNEKAKWIPVYESDKP